MRSRAIGLVIRYPCLEPESYGKPADAPEPLSYTRLASSQHSRRSAFRQLQPVIARWLHEPPDDARSSDIGCNLAEVPSVQVNQQFAEDVIDGVARCGCFGFDGESRGVVVSWFYVFWISRYPGVKFGGLVDSNAYVFFRPAVEIVAVPITV